MPVRVFRYMCAHVYLYRRGVYVSFVEFNFFLYYFQYSEASALYTCSTFPLSPHQRPVTFAVGL